MGIGKRDTAIFLAAIALTVLGVVRVFYESVVPTAAWGLSFRQEGTAPVGNAGTEQLRQYDAAYIGDTREKVLYLTFDAGYENGSTEKILDTLKAHKVPAAFFLVGSYIERNRDLVRRQCHYRLFHRQRGNPVLLQNEGDQLRLGGKWRYLPPGEAAAGNQGYSDPRHPQH